MEAMEMALAVLMVETTNSLTLLSHMLLKPFLQMQKTATLGAAPTTPAATTPTTDKPMARTATAVAALATTPETTPTATTTADGAAAATSKPPSKTTATTAERTERADKEISVARHKTISHSTPAIQTNSYTKLFQNCQQRTAYTM